MRKGWLIFNSILLGLSIALSFLEVILLLNSGILVMFNQQTKLVITIAVIFGTFAVNAVWGLLVEMANNIVRQGNQCPPVQAQPESQPNNVMTMSKINVPQKSSTWKCKNCGEESGNDCLFCQNCGKRRDETLEK